MHGRQTSETTIRPAVGLDDRELAGGPFRAIALLYATGGLFASIVMVATGNNVLFFYMHAGFILALAGLLFQRGFAAGFWRPVIRHWSSLFLAAFLVYFLVMALLHPDAEITRSYTRAIFTMVVPGLLMGYVAFALYGDLATSAASRGEWRPGSGRIVLDLLAVTAFGATLLTGYLLFLPELRRHILTLAIPSEQRIYQLYGNYTIISVALFLHVISPYFDHRLRHSLASAAWAALISVAAVASIMLAQMVGSNIAMVVVLPMVGLLAGLRVLRDLRAGTPEGRRSAVAILAVGTVFTFGLWQFLAYLRPLRIFNYREIPGLW
jgi:hypothetical protein